MSRPICEACRSIDIRRIYREGRLHAGKCFVLPWTRAENPHGQAYVLVGDDAIFLVFEARSDEGSECTPVIRRVPITWTHLARQDAGNREGRLHAGKCFVLPWSRAENPHGQAYVLVGDDA